MAQARPLQNPKSKSKELQEGCGKIGPIRSIFFAEFHPTAGPMIRCQTKAKEKDRITQDVFDSVACYIITKPQLDRTLLTVNVLEQKICGYPVILRNEKYKRNQFMFNVCFVCYHWSRTVQYEPALIKLSKFLIDLELEFGFLSSEENNPVLEALLEKVFVDLNEKGECSAEVLGRYTLKLKVISNAPDPPPVREWDVPVLMVDIDEDEDSMEEWDLTIQQILPHIDGVTHVAKIANQAGVDASLVKAAIQNLHYHSVVAILPIFMYQNVYCCEPQIADLRNNAELRAEFMEFIQVDEPEPPTLPVDQLEEQVAAEEVEGQQDDKDYKVPGETTTVAEPETDPVKFKDIYKMICDFNHHTTVIDIVVRYRPRERFNVDEVKLVQFLVLKGILRKVHKIPVYLTDANNVAGSLGTQNAGGTKGASSEFYHFFTGQKSLDEICCRTGMNPRRLEDLIDNDPNVYLLRQ